jgi:predicted hydrolase (HD superfamily)
MLASQPRRFRHVEGAARAAAHVATRLPELPRGILISAAWLHDIGYAPDVQRSGFHPLDGAMFLDDGDWDPMIVRLVAHHSHARLLAPHYDVEAELTRYAPVVGLLADAVTFADVVAGVDGTGVTVEERITELRSRTGVNGAAPEIVREARFRLLRQSTDNVARAMRRSARTST